MRGNLLFYMPTDWIGRLVAWATNGPFCNVAIDMGDGTKIEADSHGIVRISTHGRTPAATFNTAKEVPGIEDGMTWLQKQLPPFFGRGQASLTIGGGPTKLSTSTPGQPMSSCT
jgi:hypothetical protein